MACTPPVHESHARDGIGYWCRLAEDNLRVDMKWSNPRAPEYARQLTVIRAFRRVLRSVDLYPER
jgi:hypothetical protein